MLRHLSVKNFKSWHDLSMKFSPITGIFGANSSGKSSILQILLMLKQTWENQDRSLALDFGSIDAYVNLGSFQDAVYKNENTMSWGLEWNLGKELSVRDVEGDRQRVLFKDDIISLHSEVCWRGNRADTNYIRWKFANNFFSLRRKGESSGFQLDSKLDSGKSSFKFKRAPGRAWELPGPVKSAVFPEQVYTYYQNSGFLSNFGVAWNDLMRNIYYLGPLREYPKREYLWSGARPNDVGRKGERVVDAVLAATTGKEQRHRKYRSPYRSFQEFLAAWLRDMGLVSSFEVKEIAKNSGMYKVHVKTGNKSKEVVITDVGFGVSQLLPVLVLLYYVPEGSIVVLEQPEIHLHPSVQSFLGDIIINAVKTRHIQVVLESHSEHLLLRFQRRIAEGADSEGNQVGQRDFSLYFCAGKDGSSRICPLGVDLLGRIDNWPKDFFGDSFGEVAATQLARLKRQSK